MGSAKTRRNVVVSLVVGLLFLGLAFWGIDLRALARALQGADYVWIIPAFLFMLLFTAQRALRLMTILKASHPISFSSSFAINCVGFMAINLFPARLGELVRPWLLLERERVPIGTAFAGILLERLFDFLSMVALLFAVAIFVDLPVDSFALFGERYPVMELGRRMAIFLAFPVVAFVVGLIVLERQVMAVARWAAKPLPDALAQRLLHLLQTFITAMHQIKDPKLGLSVALQTAGIWVLTPLAQLCVLRAFSIELGYGPAAAILSATLVGLLIPAPPGFAGNYEAFTMAGLALFAITGEVALAYALVVHGVQFITTVGLGMFFLWKDGISFRSITAAGMGGGLSGEAPKP